MNKSILRLSTIIILLTATLITNSCGTSAMQETSIDFKEHTATAGRVVGSITFVNTKPVHEGYWLTFISQDPDPKIARRNSSSVTLGADNFERKFTGEVERGQTYIFTQELEVGSYDLSKMMFIHQQGLKQIFTTYYGFSIPFNVQKGKITYVGNVVVDESIMGQEYFISYKNSYARDINAIRRTYPEVIWTRALNDTTRKIEYGKFFEKEIIRK